MTTFHSNALRALVPAIALAFSQGAFATPQLPEFNYQGRLEQNGYVRRAASTEDARKVHVLITPAGEQILARLTRAHQREHQQLHAVVEALVKLERSNSDTSLS